MTPCYNCNVNKLIRRVGTPQRILLLLSCRERAVYYYYLYYISILRDSTLIGLSEMKKNRIDSILADYSDNGNMYDSRDISCRYVSNIKLSLSSIIIILRFFLRI